MQALDLLGALSAQDVEWLLANAQARSFPPGLVLIREGQTPEAIYFVIDGLLDVGLDGVFGQPMVIDRCARGTVIGEMSSAAAQGSSGLPERIPAERAEAPAG